MNPVLHKEIWIEAPIEKVFACFTEAEVMLTWSGKEATLDPTPGGVYRVVFENGDIIEGEYKEVIPYSRVVYTANYGGINTLVSIDLAEENGGTTIKLKQEFVADVDTSGFDGGWDYFLGILKEVIEA